MDEDPDHTDSVLYVGVDNVINGDQVLLDKIEASAREEMRRTPHEHVPDLPVSQMRLKDINIHAKEMRGGVALKSKRVDRGHMQWIRLQVQTNRLRTHSGEEGQSEESSIDDMRIS